MENKNEQKLQSLNATKLLKQLLPKLDAFAHNNGFDLHFTVGDCLGSKTKCRLKMTRGPHFNRPIDLYGNETGDLYKAILNNRLQYSLMLNEMQATILEPWFECGDGFNDFLTLTKK